jgi:pimeloyl-ACP methyl ester carboxylesterase
MGFLPPRFLNIDPCTVGVATLPRMMAGGMTLVWLHGLGGASTITFADVARHPSLQTVSSVLMDLPGAGHSRAPATWGGTIDELADVVLRTIDAVTESPIVLFGHSLGGSVAIAAATQRPDKVQHLIVAEPNLDPGIGTISQTIARQEEAVFVAYGYQRLVAATARLAQRGRMDARGWLSTLRLADPRQLHRAATSLLAPREPTFRQHLMALSMPTTIITGQRTPPPEPPLAERANLWGYVVPNAGHQMFDDNRDAFVAVLAKVVNSSIDHGR